MMPRKTARQEAEKILRQCMDETKAAYLTDIQQTRQPTRRQQLLFELDALDTVSAKIYKWLNALDDAA